MDEALLLSLRSLKNVGLYRTVCQLKFSSTSKNLIAMATYWPPIVTEFSYYDSQHMGNLKEREETAEEICMYNESTAVRCSCLVSEIVGNVLPSRQRC